MATSDSLFARAVALHREGKLDEAQRLYRTVLAEQAEHADALHMLGVIEVQQRRVAAGIQLIQRAIELKPADASLYCNLGEAYRAQGRFDLAVTSYRQALLLNARVTEVHNNLGLALQALGDWREARAAFEASLRLQPQNAEAHFNLSRLLLQQGDWQRGWREHAWRTQIFGHPAQSMTRAAWDGLPRSGRTLLVYGEQGLGDTLQFVRYVALVQQRVGTVQLQVARALVPLLTASGYANLWPHDQPAPPHDMQCSLLDLPGRLFPDAADYAAEIPYLRADPTISGQWRARLGDANGLRVGIAWQGNRAYFADSLRSIPLAQFAPLAAVPGVRLYRLHKHADSEPLDAGGSQPLAVSFADLDTAHGPFMDTAALMTCLDVVVTSDTAIAHLAGGLGVPTWVALGFSPDWRWLLDREDSPWYPSMRLFRQRRAGDWGEVFARIARELAELAKRKGGG